MAPVNTTVDNGKLPSFGKRMLVSIASQRSIYMAVLGLAIVTAFWQSIISIFSVPIYLFPSPIDVGIAFSKDYGLLMDSVWVTTVEALLGFLLGNTIAILVAVAFVYNKVTEELFYPVAILINTIPILAIAPVLKILLGNGIEPKVVIAALISFFPTLVNSVRGFQAVNPQLLELLHIFSASKTEIFLRVRFYSALPYIFSALKISVTMSVLGAIVGEWIGANKGLGYLLLQSMFDFNMPRLFATIVVASMTAIFGFALVAILEKKVVTWDPGVSM